MCGQARGEPQPRPPPRDRELPHGPVFEGFTSDPRHPARQCPSAIAAGQDLERRILLFLYPQAHTVTLDDLREPNLIDSLKAFQQTVSDFESSTRKAR